VRVQVRDKLWTDAYGNEEVNELSIGYCGLLMPAAKGPV